MLHCNFSNGQLKITFRELQNSKLKLHETLMSFRAGLKSPTCKWRCFMTFLQKSRMTFCSVKTCSLTNCLKVWMIVVVSMNGKRKRRHAHVFRWLFFEVWLQLDYFIPSLENRNEPVRAMCNFVFKVTLLLVSQGTISDPEIKSFPPKKCGV